MEYRTDGFSDVLHSYREERLYSGYSDSIYIPDYDLSEKYLLNGLFSKIIDRPAEEACKHGIDYNTGDTDLVDFLDEQLDRLDWEDKATTAIRWARLFGGSIIVMLMDDGRGLEEPVNWEDVREVAELRVYERAVVQPDPETYRTGEAEYFDVSSLYGGTFRVHSSRCLVFKNGALPEYGTAQQYFYWGLPEYVRINRDLNLAVKTHTNAAKMLEKSVQAVYKQKNLQQTLATNGGDEMVLKRIDVLDAARGIMNTIAIDKDGEEYDFKTFQLTGTRDILESACNLLSAVTCIPQTILFGRSPAGETATGESDLENYYNFIEGIQKRMLKKNIRILLKAVIKAGVYQGEIENPRPIKPTFKPLWSLNEQEQAQVDLVKAQTAQANAQTVQMYMDMQVMGPDEVRAALKESGKMVVEDILDNIEDDPKDGWEQILQEMGGEEGINRTDEFKEHEHPRDKDGKFAESGSSGSSEKTSSQNQAEQQESSSTNTKLPTNTMPITNYIDEKGNVDMGKMNEDYGEFLNQMEPQYKMGLGMMMNSTTYEERSLSEDTPFGYSPKNDTIYYDSSCKSFRDIDFTIVNTHELAHVIDSRLGSPSSALAESIQKAGKIAQSNIKKIQDFCVEDGDGFLSDICDALAEGKADLTFSHDTDYWKQDKAKEREIFANFYSLKAVKDQRSLDFLKETFPDFFEECDKATDL